MSVESFDRDLVDALVDAHNDWRGDVAVGKSADALCAHLRDLRADLEAMRAERDAALARADGAERTVDRLIATYRHAGTEGSAFATQVLYEVRAALATPAPAERGSPDDE